MIQAKYFVDKLHKQNIDFFTGVPDSLLKNICAYITDTLATEANIISPNEGAAVGLAAGYYLATSKIPVVYMQNSGIGNVVNPLMSLTDKEVYNIPLLMLIGWRGEPGVKDEPQHIKQGKVTIPLLESMGIKYEVLSRDTVNCAEQIERASNYMNASKEPFAFIIQKDTFEDYKLQKDSPSKATLSREDAIKSCVNLLTEDDIIVSTTGMISRELFEYREALKQGHKRDFLTVGSMGHASQIALGVALQKPNRRVFCFDGDGATLMHMGSLTSIGSLKPNNYIHIIFNNGAHDSVGGQPTVGFDVNLTEIAKASGYKEVYSTSDISAINDVLANINESQLPLLLEIIVKRGARKDLGRPTTKPVENKQSFMQFLKNI